MGDLPNVTGLVYVAAFAPDAGESAGSITQANPPAAASSITVDSDGYLWITPEQFHESFAQDLPADEALVMAVTQKAPVASTFDNTVTAPAWKVKPTWYQISTEDRMINPDNQKAMSDRMDPVQAISLDASHASLASRPKEITELIVAAVNHTV